LQKGHYRGSLKSLAAPVDLHDSVDRQASAFMMPDYALKDHRIASTAGV